MSTYTYDVLGYGSMITDKVRIDAYTKALRQAVKPGCVVLDIGTGTGFFAMLACQFGARRVYAIEPGEVIQVAREISAANSYHERIEFIQDISTRVTLPELVDVIISDLRGILPLFQHHIPSIVDARRRLLASGGVLIPMKDTLWAAVVEAPDLYKKRTVPWDDHYAGFDMKAALRFVTNGWQKARVKPEQLLLEAKRWAELDYATVENPNIKGEVTWNVDRAGIAHGLSVWFDAMLAEEIQFSNAPSSPELIYGSVFMPWLKPVALSVGDTVSIELQADLVGEDYVWRWNTRILEQGRRGKIRAEFEQSTFFGDPLSLSQLRKQAASHKPLLDKEGQVDQFILRMMDGQTSLEEISKKVLNQFPAHFAKWENALTHVGELSQKYSQ